MMSRKPKLELLADDLLGRMARILGEASAAASAIRERDVRRKNGEDAVVYRDLSTGSLVVGPRLEAAGDA